MFNWFNKNKQKDTEQDKNKDLESDNNTSESQTQNNDAQAEKAPANELESSKSEENKALRSPELSDEPSHAPREESQADTADVEQAEQAEQAEQELSQQELLTKEVNEQEIHQEEIAAKSITPEEVTDTEISAETIVESQQELAELEKEEKTPTPPVQEKQGFFSRLKSSLSRTKENIGSGFVALLKGKSIDDDLYEELETQLLVADVGMQTTAKIINKLTENAKLSQLKDGDALALLLKQQMRDILTPVSQPLVFNAGHDEQGKALPFVILMVGVNGVGKTTTIGKLAKQFQAQGKKVMLAAGDTFRAAAVEQLQVWGERNDIQVISQPTGSDSASVIFDAVASAKAKGADVLIADTAGRLQNKDNLIEELKKVVRVMKKQVPDAPHEIMLTLDASTGQNAVSQTKIFNEAVGITGINLTKLDGTAKGGVIFALADEFKIPVRYIGIGEGIDDLRPFEAGAFVDALFDETK